MRREEARVDDPELSGSPPCARFAITMMSATMIAQPPIQPAHGPIARVTHENVVPQSGSARFM